MTLFEKLKTLVQSQLPARDPLKQDQPAPEIPQDWLNKAQEEVGTLSPRADVEAARSAENKSAFNTLRLREGMLNQLSVEEIDVIAKQLQLPVTLAGGKGRRVLAVLTAAERSGKLENLLEFCQTLDPDYDWKKQI